MANAGENMNLIPDELIKAETPFLIINEGKILENLEILRSRFSPETGFYYSVKTNYELPVLKTLATAGIGAEVSSGFELSLAREAGFPPEKTIFDGPAWKEEELEAAVRAKIRMFNLDSLTMAAKLDEVSTRLNSISPVTIRIQAETYPRVGFLPRFARKFGVPPRALRDLLAPLTRMKGLNLAGLSTHTGTALSYPGPLLKAIDTLAKLAGELRSRDFPVNFLNLGGGLPAPGVRALSSMDLLRIQLGFSPAPLPPGEPDLSDFCRVVAEKISRELNPRKLQVAFEPGRSLVSNAGLLVTRVISIKNNWIFLDGGVNLLPESPFFLKRRFFLAARPGEKTEKRFNLSGPSLNTADVIGLGIPLPRPEIGDLLVTENAGAYTISRANQFTRLRSPVYFQMKNGKIKTCRRAETLEDLLRIWPS
ncbi:MAG: alanine racemase [Proteobacteria bacterium]|nr:alanine racemase [Pseudomonadota bacterium]